MTVVNPKSISGINSITTVSGSDNLLTIHTNDGTERVRVDSTGTTKVGSGITLSSDGDVFTTGVSTFSSNVNIGVGTTGFVTITPDAAIKVKVQGTSEQDIIHISTGNTTPYANIRGDNEGGIRIRGGGSFDGGTIELAGGLRDTDPGIIKFSSGTGSSVNETARIDKNGRLGIGTNNPNNLLHAYGGQIKAQTSTDDTNTNVDLIRAQSGSTGNALFAIRAANAADNNSSWDIKTNANEDLSFTIGAGSEKVRIKEDGKVGIGSTNPTTTLDVNGDVKVGTAVTITESGIAVAGAAVTASNFNGGQLGRRNLLINGNFVIAQRGTSSTTMNDYFVDRWRTFGGPSGFTISRQDDLTYPDGKYGIRMHRTQNNTQTNNHGVGQGVETKTSKVIAGKRVTLSFKARRGADFSGSSNQLTATINGGEGTDENPFGMTNTNGASVACTLAETAASYQLSFDVPSDKTQLTVLFSYTPSGTAGANDWFEVADCQLEVGEKTPFEILSEGEQLALCQRYFQKHGYGAYVGFNFIGRKTGSDTVVGVINGYPPMRAAATGAHTGQFRLYRVTDGSTHSSSSVAVSVINDDRFNAVKFTAACTTFSTGNMATVYTSSSGGSYTLDAEL